MLFRISSHSNDLQNFSKRDQVKFSSNYKTMAFKNELYQTFSSNINSCTEIATIIKRNTNVTIYFKVYFSSDRNDLLTFSKRDRVRFSVERTRQSTRIIFLLECKFMCSIRWKSMLQILFPDVITLVFAWKVNEMSLRNDQRTVSLAQACISLDGKYPYLLSFLPLGFVFLS